MAYKQKTKNYEEIIHIDLCFPFVHYIEIIHVRFL